ncbi:MAG: DUF6247 family protein [Sporichthyaceae bacterium]
MPAASIPSGPAPAGKPSAAAADLGDLSPRDIHACLLPEEAETFDAQFRSAMTEAAENLDLTNVLEFLRHWRTIALASTADPDSHRRIMATAARLATGEDVATEPWQTTKTRLGL